MKAAINCVSVLSVLFTLSVSSVALATDYQEIPSSQLENYKEGVRVALEQNRMQCIFKDVFEFVRYAQKAKMEVNGEQPILVFESYSDNNSVLSVTRIVSSPDYREIKRASVDHYRWQNANQGTLREPQIVKAWVLLSSVKCGGTN